MLHRLFTVLSLVAALVPAVTAAVTAAAPRPLALTPNDPAWPDQREMRQIEADKAWELTTGSPAVVIAVVDSGTNGAHVDLAGRVLDGRNFVSNRAGQRDDDGHGTLTASVAAGAGNNGQGMAGVCWQCRVLPAKVFEGHRTSDEAFTNAIRYAADSGARVINISAGGFDTDSGMESAVNHAAARGALVVVSAGNTPDNLPIFPASYPAVMAVAASGLQDNVTGFSTYADWVDIAAPGINITGATYDNRTGTTRASGTSFSAPLVAGVAGLLFSVRPELTADQARFLLQDTAIDIGAPGRDNHFGHGRLSAFDAVLAAARPGPSGDASVQAATNGAQVQLAAAGFAANEPVRAWLANEQGRVIVLRGLAVDGGGSLNRAVNLTSVGVPGPYVLTVYGEQSRRVAQASLVAGAETGALVAFRPLSGGPADRLFFRETGHTLGGAFRAYWERRGGLPLFGFPISEEFEEVNAADGNRYVVQYFERNRFEYHPEHRGTVYEVQLGLLGSQLTRGREFAAANGPVSGGLYFPETRHTLRDDFRAYWEARGGLAIFGFPISEPIEEDGRITQYFERNRFELFPENGPEYRVQLGLLGRDLARANGYLP